MRKTSGLADVVAEALEPLSGRVDVAVIFGSVARGTETEGSDVDVLIIGSVDFGTIIDALHPAQQQLRREINPKVFAAAEWKSKLKAKNPFVLDVLANAKIFLLGDEHELAELSRRNLGADHPRPRRQLSGSSKVQLATSRTRRFRRSARRRALGVRTRRFGCSPT